MYMDIVQLVALGLISGALGVLVGHPLGWTQGYDDRDKEDRL